MSSFSVFLSSGLFSGTFLAPALAETEDSLRTELLQHLNRDAPADFSSATIRFTVEPDRKLVLLQVEGEEASINRQVVRCFSDYQVLADSVQIFVIYQMSLYSPEISAEAAGSERSFWHGVGTQG
jgi:hypothetical protein